MRKTMVKNNAHDVNDISSSAPTGNILDGNPSTASHHEAMDKTNDAGATLGLSHGILNLVTVCSTESQSVVFWDGDDDPQNPCNWSTRLKVVNCVLISMLTFITPLASSMIAPGVPDLMAEFESTNSLLSSFCVSVYVLGFAAGPLLFAPLSELYGRFWVYQVANIGFIAFTIACALAPSLNLFILFRFLSGALGSAPLANCGGSVADMIVQERRGAAMAGITIGPLLGPIIGPIVGGIVTNALGWRWIFWILVIVAGFTSITFYIFARETYAPAILQKKVNRLRKQTGNTQLKSKLQDNLDHSQHFRRSFLRPIKMLLFSPVCAICNIYVSIVYGYLYLMFSSVTPLFIQQYNFDTTDAGLTFLGIGIGSLLGVAYFSASSDRYLKKKATEYGQGTAPQELAYRPEDRLPPLHIGAVLLPAGLLLYGWTAYYRVHWIVPVLGTAVVGMGNLVIAMSLQTYLIDAFTPYAASALAANTVARSIGGAVLPLAGLPMYNKLGIGWGNSVLAFIAIVLIPVPWVFIRHGEYLRKQFALKDL